MYEWTFGITNLNHANHVLQNNAFWYAEHAILHPRHHETTSVAVEHREGRLSYTHHLRMVLHNFRPMSASEYYTLSKNRE